MLKKAISLALAVASVVAISTGCSSGNKTSGTNSGTPYTVNFVYHAPKMGNQGDVEKAINALPDLKKMNMKVHLIPLDFDSYTNKLPVMLAAKEPLDISFIFTWNFANFLDSGYIVNAADYKEYTKDIYKVLGDEADAGYIGNIQLGFPTRNVRSAPSAIFVRKDIFDALGYKADDFKDVSTDNFASFDKITNLFAAIKKKYPNMTVFDGHRIFGYNYLTYVDGFGDSFGVLENYGQTTKITNWYESEQYKNFAMLARKWNQAGYFSKDIAVEQALGQAKMKAGNCAAFFANYGPNWFNENKNQTGYETVLIPVSKQMKMTSTVAGQLNCVLSQSKDKVKAFQFLNWAYTSVDFNNMLNWGVPGKDWVKNADGQADYPAGVTAANVNYHEDFGFIYPNQYLITPWAGTPKNIWDMYKNFDKNALISKAYKFAFDSSKVSNEEQQCSAALSKYEAVIEFGAIDPITGIAKLNRDLKIAGIDKIMAEKQKQLDDWLAKQK